jgi:hypothetical protein
MTASRQTLRRTFACLASFAAFVLAPTAVDAVVYCKTVGVPKGCVAAPGVVRVAPVVAAPVVVPRAVVATPRVGVVAPRYGVGVGARGVGVRPGTPANRGGPVNRVGRR